MKTISDKLFAKLRELAPSISFSVSRERDDSIPWDGDGPDSKRRGYFPYTVTVTAKAIVNGQLIEEETHLGGAYYRRDEPIGMVHGYLPQMLEEATVLLIAIPGTVVEETLAVRSYLRDYMRQEWEKQQAERAAS